MSIVLALAQCNVQLCADPKNLSLGWGTFSEVYKGTYQNRNVAVKVSANELASLTIRNEFQAYKKLGNHANILEMLNGFSLNLNPACTALVLEHFYTDCHREFIVGVDPTAQEVADLSLQLFRALEHIHSKGVIHRDVHAANILVNRMPRVRIKLSDFGSSTYEGSSLGGIFVPDSRFATSYEFRSPECVTGLPIGSGVDMWAGATAIHNIIIQRDFLQPPVNEGEIDASQFANLYPEFIVAQLAYVLESPAPASYRNSVFFDGDGYMKKSLERTVHYKRSLLSKLTKKSETATAIRERYEHWPEETVDKYAGWINKLLVWENRPTAADMCQLASIA